MRMTRSQSKDNQTVNNKIDRKMLSDATVTEEDEPFKVNAFNPDQYVNEKPIVSDFANLAKMNSQKGEARYG